MIQKEKFYFVKEKFYCVKEKFYFVKEKFYFVKLIIVIFTALILSGCIPNVGTSGQQGTGEYVKEKVVDGFPALPFYQDSEVIESYGFGGAYGASFITGDDLQKVVKFYNDSLPKLGWDSELAPKSQTNYVWRVKNQEYSGEVIVNTTSDGEATAINMSVSSRQ